MDFNIQLAAKNEVMSYVKMILPVAGTMVGVFIGIFASGWRERRKRRQEIQNMRLMMYTEVQRIRTGIGGMSYIKDIKGIEEAALGVDYMTEATIYNAYLGQLNMLSVDELMRLDPLYFELAITRKDSLRIRTKAANKKELTEDDKKFVKGSIALILHYSTNARDCIERYAGREVKLIKADHIRRELMLLPHEYDRRISHIVGCEPEEVKRIRAEMKAKGEIKPIEVDEDKIDDI